MKLSQKLYLFRQEVKIKELSEKRDLEVELSNRNVFQAQINAIRAKKQAMLDKEPAKIKDKDNKGN